jgi:hypothetical protein
MTPGPLERRRLIVLRHAASTGTVEFYSQTLHNESITSLLKKFYQFIPHIAVSHECFINS